METLAALPVALLIGLFIISLILFVMWIFMPVMVYMIMKRLDVLIEVAKKQDQPIVNESPPPLTINEEVPS